MGMSLQDTGHDFGTVVTLHGADRPLDFVLVCEHASARIPDSLDQLGLSSKARLSHAAWDIGAADIAVSLATRLNAPLVMGDVSRLVYDCNRPLDAPDCIPAQSEVFAVPGNASLNADQRQTRHQLVHEPFHAAISQLLDGAGLDTVLVTIHSFTPVYNGQRRNVDIGYLCDQDDRMALAALRAEAKAAKHRAALNAPYSASDGVTHTLQLHGEARGLANVMVEVRNDLIDTPETAKAMAKHLEGILRAARAEVLG
ncbi:N-formylglutamate amidohydrolase [Gymnodinialimonas hymeniacidonis]|uniref:N-formylglutamate amidohydrolase n=1 Tax=Gymnodinialimonas hymeniacidonis TaxID=3126508 RepID=UPI0034C612DF